MKTKYLKKVLMCDPKHFSVTYSINPWMQIGEISTSKAVEQWNILRDELEKQQIQVEIIPSVASQPDMVFAADQGIVTHNKVLMSNFTYDERKPERNLYQPWFEQHGFITECIPEAYSFEGGGECLFWNNMLLIGTGFRTKPSSAHVIAGKLNIETIPLELVDPRFYHLDVALLPLNNREVFYYPKAFSEKSQQILQKLIPHLYEIEDYEALKFAANSLVTDHHVIVQKGIPSFSEKLKHLGYVVVEVDVSEFNKAGGGIHCLTSILAEEYM